jgi:hypothetical protein
VSTDITISRDFGMPSKVFGGPVGDDELGAGISAGLAVMSYKGKVWKVRHRGEEHTLMREDGDGPRNSIDVVVVRAAPNLSKIWYEKGYEEGSTAPPDCWSSNGMNPDAGSPKRQSPTCATCPRNQRGSRITPSGKPGKECQDSKRLAIVPLDDIDNEIHDGPMLLRVPAASLGELKKFSDAMRSRGFQYYAFGMRISFDPNEAYPKFMFRAVRALTDDEAKKIASLRDDPRTMNVVQQSIEHVPSEAPAEDDPTAFIQDTPKTEAKPEPKKEAFITPEMSKPAATKTTPASKPAAAKTETKQEAKKTAPAPVVDETANSPIDDDLEKELAALGFGD